MNWVLKQYKNPTTPFIHFSLLLASWLYSGLHVMSSPALKYLPPYVFAVIRVSIAMPLLYLFTIKEPRVELTWGDSAQLIVIGISGIGIPQSVVFAVNKLVGAGILAMMIPLATIFTVVMSAILGLERVTLLKGIGVLMAVTGSIFIAWVTEKDFEVKKAWGVGLMIIQSMSWSIYLITMSKFLKSKPIPMYAYFRAVIWGFLFMLPLGAWQLPDVSWSEVPYWVWLVEVYCAILVSAGAHVMMSWLIKHCAAFLPALYLPVQPVTTVLLAHFILGERFNVWLLLCMFSILLGLLLVIFAKAKEEKQEAASSAKSTPDAVDIERKPILHVQGLDDEVPEGNVEVELSCVASD